MRIRFPANQESGRLPPPEGNRRCLLFAVLPTLIVILTAWSEGRVSAGFPISGKMKDRTDLLRQLHGEVSAFGKRPGESFVREDFHIGPADDDTNQEEHLAILIQDLDDGSKMTIQFTGLEPARHNPNIRYGKEVKTVVCIVRAEGETEVVRSDYGERALAGRLEKALEAVRNKKDLLGIK